MGNQRTCLVCGAVYPEEGAEKFSKPPEPVELNEMPSAMPGTDDYVNAPSPPPISVNREGYGENPYGEIIPVKIVYKRDYKFFITVVFNILNIIMAAFVIVVGVLNAKSLLDSVGSLINFVLFIAALYALIKFTDGLIGKEYEKFKNGDLAMMLVAGRAAFWFILISANNGNIFGLIADSFKYGRFPSSAAFLLSVFAALLQIVGALFIKYAFLSKIEKEMF